jgi:hypothetical protein
MKNFSLEQLVFVDETAKDERTPFRSYGYSSLDRRAEIKCPFIRGKRYTIEGALGINGIIAHRIQEGSMNEDDFYNFLLHDLVNIFLFYFFFKLIFDIIVI